MFTPVQKAPYLMLLWLIPSAEQACVTAVGGGALFKQCREVFLGGSGGVKGEKRRGEQSFWVIYSGGSRLNQGTAAPRLTYFDLSPCFGIF